MTLTYLAPHPRQRLELEGQVGVVWLAPTLRSLDPPAHDQSETAESTSTACAPVEINGNGASTVTWWHGACILCLSDPLPRPSGLTFPASSCPQRPSTSPSACTSVRRGAVHLAVCLEVGPGQFEGREESYQKKYLYVRYSYIQLRCYMTFFLKTGSDFWLVRN